MPCDVSIYNIIEQVCVCLCVCVFVCPAVWKNKYHCRTCQNSQSPPNEVLPNKVSPNEVSPKELRQIKIRQIKRAWAKTKTKSFAKKKSFSQKRKKKVLLIHAKATSLF